MKDANKRRGGKDREKGGMFGGLLIQLTTSVVGKLCGNDWNRFNGFDFCDERPGSRIKLSIGKPLKRFQESVMQSIPTTKVVGCIKSNQGRRFLGIIVIQRIIKIPVRESDGMPMTYNNLILSADRQASPVIVVREKHESGRGHVKIFVLGERQQRGES